MNDAERNARIAALEAEIRALRTPSPHARSCATRPDETAVCSCGARRHADTPGWWQAALAAKEAP